jgi:hypothetical protein
MSIFNREEVFVSFSSADFYTAVNALKDAGIKCRLKMRNMGRGTNRYTGINLNYSVQYAISVDGKDADSAGYFINKALHDNR